MFAPGRVSGPRTQAQASLNTLPSPTPLPRLRSMRRAALFLTLLPGPAAAHATDQAFVLLLPTDVYRAAGVAAVALTVAALFLVPDRVTRAIFAHRPRTPREPGAFATATSLLSLALFAGLIALGLSGPRDPLSNLLPLVFWTVLWAGLVGLSAVLGNLWTHLNPWTGLVRLIRPRWRQRAIPESWGLWPATALLVAFAAFLLADIAPDDPGRLAKILLLYGLATMAGALVCGSSWLRQAEVFHAIMGTYAKLAVISRSAPRPGVGGPGWQLLTPQPVAAGFFALTLLAAGSFDGLNETFWWLGLIGVNPLEFPGRSAVIGQTVSGLFATLVLLCAAFALTVWLGLKLAPRETPFFAAFARLALSLLPIALVYHVAHYLPSFLVNIQYTLAALTDPLGTGADLFGLGEFHVTTGFFNRLDTVRILWLTQAGLVVLGHVWSVLLAHRIGLDLFGGGRRAAWATLPLSLFMIGYTFLGLWLLAAPRGA